MPAAWIIALLMTATPLERRINLVDFARVVEFEPDGCKPLRDLERGADGWEAYVGSNGEYMIGVIWERPRDIAEAGIEFRHAIGNRDEVRIQYRPWRAADPPEAGSPALGQLGEDGWVTFDGDWWAGDRDVNYLAAGESSAPDPAATPTSRVCRTACLRFICGEREPPPVRYVRAYGPEDLREKVFRLELDPAGSLTWPLSIEVVNGLIVEGSRPTTTRSAEVHQRSPDVRIRYALCAPEGVNSTEVRIGSGDERAVAVFAPRTVAIPALKSMRLPGRSVTVRALPDSQQQVTTAPATRGSLDAP